MDKIGVGILKVLGVPYQDSGDGWLSIPCLFAKHTHSGGVDSKPSARFNPTGTGYKCFACNESYGKPSTILYSLLTMNAEAGINSNKVLAALEYLKTNKLPDDDKVEKQAPKEPAAFMKFPKKEFLDKFPRALKCRESLAYLVTRKLPRQAIEDFDIRFDPESRRVLFPYFLSPSNCAGAEGRLSFDPPKDFKAQNQAPRYISYRWNDKTNKSRVWFRQSELRLRKPVIVVEGCFDAIRVYCHYRNVTAMLGSFPSKTKLEYLSKFKHIFWMADNDMAGDDSKEHIAKIFPPTKITFIDVPSGYKDAADMPSAEVRGLLSQFLAPDAAILTQKELVHNKMEQPSV